jgi:hypothetical protein
MRRYDAVNQNNSSPAGKQAAAPRNSSPVAQNRPRNTQRKNSAAKSPLIISSHTPIAKLQPLIDVHSDGPP